jgi:hypothetical protein
MEDVQRSKLSLFIGGPLHRLLRRSHLERADHRDAARAGLGLALGTWAPLVVLHLLGGARDGLLRDYSVHVRLLVSIPLFFAAEALLEQRCGIAWQRFLDGGFAAAAPEAFGRLAIIAVRLRDSVVAEAVLLGIALLTAQLVPGAVFRGEAHPTAARFWFSWVALPAYQFLLYRLLWHWFIWGLLLAKLSRMPLRVIPTHPDRAGGLSLFLEPLQGFALLAFGASAAVSSSFASQILLLGVSFDALRLPIVAFVVMLVILGLGPMLPFWPKLFNARLQGLRDYGQLSVQYTRLFHRRWIEGVPAEPLLGTSDIQSLADLGNSYQIVQQMRPLPFGKRAPILLAVAAALPMLPLLLTKVPLEELIKRIAHAALGGMPL